MAGATAAWLGSSTGTSFVTGITPRKELPSEQGCENPKFPLSAVYNASAVCSTDLKTFFEALTKSGLYLEAASLTNHREAPDPLQGSRLYPTSCSSCGLTVLSWCSRSGTHRQLAARGSQRQFQGELTRKEHLLECTRTEDSSDGAGLPLHSYLTAVEAAAGGRFPGNSRLQDGGPHSGDRAQPPYGPRDGVELAYGYGRQQRVWQGQLLPHYRQHPGEPPSAYHAGLEQQVQHFIAET